MKKRKSNIKLSENEAKNWRINGKLCLKLKFKDCSTKNQKTYTRS